jgi:hypothetical protein
MGFCSWTIKNLNQYYDESYARKRQQSNKSNSPHFDLWLYQICINEVQRLLVKNRNELIYSESIRWHFMTN